MYNSLCPNDAFTAFLNILNCPNQHYLINLFTCTKYEKIIANGKKRFDGTVMDGISMGILGKLPNFQRVKNHFPRVQNLSNNQ